MGQPPEPSAIASVPKTDPTPALHAPVNLAGDDLTGDLPDECLATIFHFLGSGDRRSCSEVCRRWLRVDGETRTRLGLTAHASLAPHIPSILSRFTSLTKLALQCDRKAASLNDDALLALSSRCPNLARLKLRACRDLTDSGLASLARNCKSLTNVSFVSCWFGAAGLTSVLEHCPALEELSAKRLRGDRAGTIAIGAAAESLKAVCLKEIVNGSCFEAVISGAKNLRTLKIIRSLGDWDGLLQMIHPGLTEIHLERLQVSDSGLSAIGKCSRLEVLHVVKAPECSDLGLIRVSEGCRMLRKLHIDGWRTNRIGDEGLVSVARHCPGLQELVLIGVSSTLLTFDAIASGCQGLERLALCGSDSVGDAEVSCIAEKCAALRKLCVKGCPISDAGVEAIGRGCPSLVKLKVKKCRGVTGGIREWLQESRRSLTMSFDGDEVGGIGGGSRDAGEESGVELPQARVLPADGDQQ